MSAQHLARRSPQATLTIALLLACAWAMPQVLPLAGAQQQPAETAEDNAAPADKPAAETSTPAPETPSETTAQTPAADAPATQTPADNAPAADDAPPADDAPATEEPSAADAPETETPTTDEPSPGPGADVPADATEEGAGDVVGSADDAQDEGVSRSTMIIRLLIVAATFVIPLLLAQVFSKQFRMPEQFWRFAMVLFAVCASTAVLVLGWPPKLGIDLRGGAILVYEIDRANMQQGAQVNMDELLAAISERVNPGGIKEVVVRPYGENQIEIQIPEADEYELDRIKRIISQTGALEFRILATERDDPDLAARAEETEGRDVVDRSGQQPRVIGRWVPVHESITNQYRNSTEFVTRENRRGEVEVLVVVDANEKLWVTGDYLVDASAGLDERGQPAVDFRFNNQGALLFGELTSDNLPDEVTGAQRHLGIVLDGILRSAPSIRSIITDRGEITGRFTEEETTELASILTAGKLPAALQKEPSSAMLTGPTLGNDTIRSGVNAMLFSTGAVVVFMLIYYRFAGIAANLALILNVALTVAFMILFNAAFTLAGLAGLALTVGMAVDANVLIYERMREELERKATLRMAIRNGFERATATIIDANVTTLITAIVLYWIGTDQVKGFAVTLTLGIVMNLFTAIVCTRLLFDVAEKMRWISDLKMMKMFGKANFDFIGKRIPAIVLSLLIIGVGMVGVYLRGPGLLDIDFTGGVSVELLFDEEHPRDIAEVRSAVSELEDVVVQRVQIAGEKLDLRYLVITSEKDVDEVVGKLREIFGEELAHNRMTVANLEPYTAEGAADRLYEGGAQADLTFTSPINYPALESLVGTALGNDDPSAPAVAFRLENPDYTEGSNAAFDEWSIVVGRPSEDAQEALSQVSSALASSPFFPSSSQIGASVAGKTQLQALYALLISVLLILVYLWFRFKEVAFGISALVAVVHDVLVALGALALSLWLARVGFDMLLVEPFKLSLPIVAAFLTIIGYSLNDTIVIFDRVRELRGKSPHITAELLNISLNQTLNRTILTTLTVFLVVLILYIAGGQAIHGFAFVLVVGTLAGTYSTIYIACPMVLWLTRHERKGAGRAAETSSAVSAAS